jgi:hypothetical protein
MMVVMKCTSRYTFLWDLYHRVLADNYKVSRPTHRAALCHSISSVLRASIVRSVSASSLSHGQRKNLYAMA